ncbi:TolC family protein [Paenibacillus lentus]|uniref:TolC family protein n=1 Tax=Paenibacillus lentus TaxID=1338368 RepID=A0A3S8RST2_9BACL|nr:TolC family protein [Paenibacillus lentus]AZK45900.1 TolC family protein [Paenibacillus lentus]
MKKCLSAMISSLLCLNLLSAGPVAVYAAQADEDNTIRTGKEATLKEVLRDSFIDSGTLVPIKRLDLDTVLKLSLDHSLNYKLLTFKLTALKLNEGSLKEQKKELDQASGGAGSSYTLPESIEEIQEKYGEIPEEMLPSLYPTLETNIVVNQLLNGVGNIADAMNKQLQGQRDQLILALKQIEMEQANTVLELEEARIGIELQVTSQYAELLSLNKQRAVAEEYLEILKADMRRAELLQEMGMISAAKVTEAQREVQKQERQMEGLKNKYELALVQFCFDLGIAYDPNIVLADLPDYTPQPILRLERERILAKSFEMKRQWNSIILAKHQESHTNATNDDQEDLLEMNVRIADQQAEKARIELNKKIDELYSNAEMAYKAYENALTDYENAKQDNVHMMKRFDNGLISRHDYDKSAFILTQQETARELARIQLYVVERSVDALEKGFIM